MIGKVTKKSEVQLNQEEMFPDSFHPLYKVRTHLYYWDDVSKKSYWSSSEIIWRLKDVRSD